MATSTEQLETRRNVTGAQVVLTVLALLTLLAILWFFVLRGGADETAAAPPAPNPAATPEPEATTEPGQGSRKGPLQTFEVFAPKDPFKPLIVASDGGGTAGNATETGAANGGGVQSGPGANAGSAPSGGSDISNGNGGGSGSQNVNGRRVRLIDTFRAGGEIRARIQVDGTVYTVGEGDRFADNFEVVSLSGECASLLFGDDQFSLCEGEEILK